MPGKSGPRSERAKARARKRRIQRTVILVIVVIIIAAIAFAIFGNPSSSLSLNWGFLFEIL